MGILRGVKVIELAGMAPSPFCGMILSDYGASVIRVDKVSAGMNYDVTARGKKSIALNLKNPKGVEILRRLCLRADVLIEPFRSGIMEKLTLGPNELLADNPRLIYARLTGYGQEGPSSKLAGHDINYLAASGLLSHLGRKNDSPHAPVNLLADFAGGGLTCALGIALALYERQASGRGQVIDANMVEGAAYLGSWIYRSTQKKMFVWGKERGDNLLDGGAHFYDTYRTKDGKFVAVGALEPHFYAILLDKLGLDPQDVPQFGERQNSRRIFADIFVEKTRNEWMDVFDGCDACVTPVMECDEAHLHPHNAARNSFFRAVDGHLCPVPAPRLSRTPAVPNSTDGDPNVGQHTECVLREELNMKDDEIETLKKAGVCS